MPSGPFTCGTPPEERHPLGDIPRLRPRTNGDGDPGAKVAPDPWPSSWLLAANGTAGYFTEWQQESIEGSHRDIDGRTI